MRLEITECGFAWNPVDVLLSCYCNRHGRQKPGEEERITADQSKHHVPFPLKAPPEGLSLCLVAIQGRGVS